MIKTEGAQAQIIKIVSVSLIKGTGAASSLNEWHGETKDKVFVIRFDRGNLYFGVAENEIKAYQALSRIGFNARPDLKFSDIISFLEWQLPADYVDTAIG